MPLVDGTKIAGYKIERLLGAGGMGEVYLAQHPRLPRHDALKVLRSDVSADPDFLARFNREADLVAKLWHPHIVGIHDRGKFRGYGLARELIPLIPRFNPRSERQHVLTAHSSARVGRRKRGRSSFHDGELTNEYTSTRGLVSGPDCRDPDRGHPDRRDPQCSASRRRGCQGTHTASDG